MVVFAEIQFDAMSDDGDERMLTVIGRFIDLEQIEEWRTTYHFEPYIDDINLSLPMGWTVSGPIEIGDILPEMNEDERYHVDFTV